MRIFFLLSALLAQTALLGQNGVLRGTVTDALSNEPVGFANVLLVGAEQGATTDVDGQYEFTGLEPGFYDIRVSFIGYEQQTEYEIQVTGSKPTIVNFALQESSAQLEEVVVKASPFKKTEESPVSLRTIGVTEIQRNPGGNRDISRVLQVLPGVTSTVAFRNDLIIRGGAPNENRFYLDEVEVPTINHYSTQGASGGPVGILNVNMLREVDFYSSAFPANRGNALSSVFNFFQRDGRDDRIGGTLFVSATDAGLTLEGPIGEEASFIVSARQSYLQFLFQALELPFLPTYNDFQAKVKWKLDKKNELTFVGLGAIDRFELNTAANETEEQQFFLDNIPVSPQWNYTTGLVFKHYQERGYWTFVLSRSMFNNEAEKYENNDNSSEENLILDYRSQQIENKARVEHNIRFGDFKLLYGLGYEYRRYNNRTFNRIFTSAGPETIDFFSEFDMHMYFGFAQLSRKLFSDRLTLSAGFRLDGNSFSEAMANPLEQFSPRFSFSLNLTQRLAFNFNTGLYFQLPPYTVMGYKEGEVFVNKENGIDYIRNSHFVAGLEFVTDFSARITVEGYYKRYQDYPFLLRDSVTLANLGGDFGVVGNEPAVPRSAGRTYGLEVLYQQRLFKGFYGIASYTLGWSEFEDKNFMFIPSSWDSRHIVNLAIGKRFPRNWEVGINWRLQTGLPETPFDEEASALVLNWNVNGQGIPDFDRLNTLRQQAANTLDIRVDKKWFFPKWSLNIYLDIENVFNNGVDETVLILDRPLDDNGQPIGDGVIVNPDAPPSEQRYALKPLTTQQGTIIPSVGIQVEY